jgi:hypothetical protein
VVIFGVMLLVIWDEVEIEEGIEIEEENGEISLQ